jgi:membrane protein
MLAAGLALYGLFGALPALAAAAAVWGLFAKLSDLSQPFEGANSILPEQAIELLKQFVTSVPAGFGWGVGFGLSLGFAIWSAARAASGLITALNIAYDRTEQRSRPRRAGVALLVALGGTGVLLCALVLLTVPALLAARSTDMWHHVILLARWPALAVLFALALGLLFRFAPSPGQKRTGWLNWGAVIGTVLWAGASFGMSLYVRYLGGFGRLYGSLGTVVVVMLWFYFTALAVLVGAEVNAMREQLAEGRPKNSLKHALRQREARRQ